MPWFYENNGTALHVWSLLTQIESVAQQCTLHLDKVVTHQARCVAQTPNDRAHTDIDSHGPDGNMVKRPVAYANLVAALAALTAARTALSNACTEMSHGGMP
jgi:hypothetical protein